MDGWTGRRLTGPPVHPSARPPSFRAMSPTRREALVELSALLAIPLVRWPERLADPLAGTIADYQAGRARRDWSAAEVTQHALDRANSLNGWLRAIDELSPTALDDARASDARARSGTLRGPLDGVPVFAKAIYDMNGLPTTGSSAEWAKLFPGAVGRDSLEVARMRAAGAIVLGKTAADDFAYHGNGTSSLTGQVRNPYDPSGVKTPGGSSAGSAVSVACGIAFAALGTDDGGSNRIPAQFCGIVGMKPTFGLVAAHRRDPHVAVPRHARPARAPRRRRGACCSTRSRGPTHPTVWRSRRRGRAASSPRCATTRSPALGSASSTRTCLARR